MKLLISLGLAALGLPVIGSLASPPAYGRAVPQDEAANVHGAWCADAGNTTHPGCDPNDTHGVCFFLSYGNTPVWDFIWLTNGQLGKVQIFKNCPCSSGLKYGKVGGGTCVGTPNVYETDPNFVE